MTQRRSPTAATFATLAVLSAVACVALPEIADLTYVIWRQSGTHKAPPVRQPGPRVMGALHTSADVEIAVDRFRFAAGSPFLDVDVVPSTPTGWRMEPADFALDLPPENIVPATDATMRNADLPPQPDRYRPEPDRSGPASPSAADLAAPAVGANSGATRDAGREAGEVTAVNPPVPKPEPEPVLRPEPELKPGSTPELPHVSPNTSAPEPAPAPQPVVVPEMISPSSGADRESRIVPVRPPVARNPVAEKPSSKRQVYSAPTPKRTSAPAASSNRRKGAASDDGGEAPAAKAKWRPENLNNWPD